MNPLDALREAGPRGATVKELADRLGLPRADVEAALQELAARGEVVYARQSRFQITGRWISAK